MQNESEEGRFFIKFSKKRGKKRLGTGNQYTMTHTFSSANKHHSFDNTIVSNIDTPSSVLHDLINHNA